MTKTSTINKEAIAKFTQNEDVILKVGVDQTGKKYLEAKNKDIFTWLAKFFNVNSYKLDTIVDFVNTEFKRVELDFCKKINQKIDKHNKNSPKIPPLVYKTNLVANEKLFPSFFPPRPTLLDQDYVQGNWRFFSKGDAPSLARTKEEAKKQWKVFLNPKPEEFESTFNRTISALDGMPYINGKTIAGEFRKSEIPALKDPCEPKIVLYFSGPKSEEDFKEAIKRLENEFTDAEKVGAPQGKRKRDNGEEVPQWGPSFTKMRNPLIFYTQGGYTESERNEAVLANNLDELFEGENYYLHKGSVDPLASPPPSSKIQPSLNPSEVQLLSPKVQENKQHLIHFYLQQQRRLNDLKTELKTATPDKARRIEQEIIKIEQGDIQRAKIKLSIELKREPSMSELAAFLGKSTLSLSLMILGQAYQKAAQDLDIEQLENLHDEVLEQLENKVCESLKTTPEEINTCFHEMEIVNQLENLLTQLGAEGNVLFSTEFLDTLLKGMEENIHLFDRPFDLIKLQNILTRVNESTFSHARLKIWNDTIHKLLRDIASNMQIKRQDSTMKLLQYWQNVGDIHQAVNHAFYRDLIENTNEIDHQKGMIEAKIHYIKQKTEEQIAALKSIREKSNPTSQEVISALPESLHPLFKEKVDSTDENALKDFLDLTIKKLENIKQRQEKRLKTLKEGQAVIIPQYFHATNVNAAASIAKTGIEAVQASSGFGAFYSTAPEFRYGYVALGLPKLVEFNSQLKTYYDANSKNISLNLDKKTAWAGLKDLININPRIVSLQKNFSSTIEKCFANCQIPLMHPQKRMELEERIKMYLNRSVVFRWESSKKGWSLNYRNLDYYGQNLPETELFEIQNDLDFSAWLEHIVGLSLNSMERNLPDKEKTPRNDKNKIINNIQHQFIENFKSTYFFETNGETTNQQQDQTVYFIKEKKTEKKTEKIKASVIAPDDEVLFKEFYQQQYVSKTKNKNMKMQSISEVKIAFTNAGLTDDLVEFIPLSEQLIERDFLTQVDAKVPKKWGH